MGHLQHYQVQETVVSYGYMHHWTVGSDFGTFEAIGDGALRSLIREIHAERLFPLLPTRQNMDPQATTVSADKTVG